MQCDLTHRDIGLHDVHRVDDKIYSVRSRHRIGYESSRKLNLAGAIDTSRVLRAVVVEYNRVER